MKMVKKEWKHIWKNKLLLLTFVGMLCIPILYAGFFLKSVWDPYGNTSELPIAVVNNDQPLKNDLGTFNVGQEMVDSLEKNSDMDWVFTTSTEAQEGLNHQKYYMIVTIPQDFSKNAATVLDKNPQQMEIEYKTNGSHNFIGEVMGGAGIKALKAEVSEKVTAAYVDAVVSSIDDVKKGFSQAASGSQQLNDGTIQLASGSLELNNGLELLANSTIQFNDGVETFSVGLQQYVDGVQQANSGMQTLNTGVKQLSQDAPMLTESVGQLAKGSATLNKGVVDYVSGVDSVAQGTTELSQKGNALQQGIQQSFLQMVTTFGQAATTSSQLSVSAENIVTNLPDSESLAILKEDLLALQTSINELPNQSDGLSPTNEEIVDEESKQALVAIADSVTENIATIESLENELAVSKQTTIDRILESPTFMALTEEEQKELAAVINAEVESLTIETSIDNVVENLSTILGELESLNIPQVSFEVTAENTQPEIEAVISSANNIIPEVTTVLEAFDTSQSGLITINQGLNSLSQGLTTAQVQTETGASVLNNNVSSYVGGVKK